MAVKELILMRHAKSSWGDASLADFDRPLNERGKKDAPRMGRLLESRDLGPEMILSSAAKRTRETVLGLWEGLGIETQVNFLRSFYHGGEEEFIEELILLEDEISRAMIVGHNPGMEYFLEALSGKYERMPTGAVAWIELDIEHWADLSGDFESKLRGYWIPKEIEE